MTQEVTNFARFYSLLNKLPYDGDREELKREIIMQCTENRTDSLKELTRSEYEVCCAAIDTLIGYTAKQKRLRSECLKLMQKLGLDTTDWARINDFCRNPRIAGKPFARLKIEELKELAIKLRTIKRKGGLKQGAHQGKAPRQATVKVYVLPVSVSNNGMKN